MKKNNQLPVTKNELQEVLKNYPTNDYLEERLELFEKGIISAIDERMDRKFERFEEKLVARLQTLQNSILSALGSTIVGHEQRITILEQEI